MRKQSLKLMRLVGHLLGGVVGLALGLSGSLIAAHAEENISSEGINIVQPEDRGGAPAGSIGFYSQTYLYAPGSGKDPNFFSIMGTYQGQSTGHYLDAKGDFEGVAIVKPATTWTVEAPEAYVGTSPDLSQTTAVRVGRELHHWSTLDEDFQLGIWQPRFLWDYVHPQQIGFAGVHVDVKTDVIQFTAFASPIYVPDRGIPVEVQNSQIYKIDPYFNPPANSIPFQGVQTPVNYNIAYPATSSILFNPGGSMMLRVGRDQGAWAMAAAGFQPINQLLMSYDGVLDMGSNPQQIDATLYPRIAYHQVDSLETGYGGSWYTFSMSSLYDRPFDNQPILGENIQELTTATSLSPAVEARFGDKDAPTRVRLAGLRVWGGDAPDQGPLTSGYSSAFDNRYFSHTAAVLYGDTPLDFISPRLSGRYKLLVDIEHAGTIQSTDLYYFPERVLMVNLGADFLNSNEDASATDPISEYRADDRVRFGVSYVF
jgi:hypothetical protein